MSRARTYARNLLASWAGFGANVVVMFLLSPFIVHSLGNTAYGVWTIVMSLTGYLGLVEMGVRLSLGRHIAYYIGLGDDDSVNAVISTAMLVFVVCGIVILVASVVIAIFLSSLFIKIPPDLIPSARIVVFIVACNLWVSLLSASFNQILTARERFELLHATAVAVLLLRALGTVVVLSRGGGLIHLACVQLATSTAGAVCAYLLSRRVFRPLRIGRRLAAWSRLRELLGYGIWAFIGNTAEMLIYWTDVVIIGAVFGPAIVTFYSIPLMLIHYGNAVCFQVASVLGPRTVAAAARKEFTELRWLFVWGSKAVACVAIPVFVMYMVFGTHFITLWMGQQYAIGGTVLVYLAISQLVRLCAVLTRSVIASGFGHARIVAGLGIVQGVCNLILTLVLVLQFRMGLIGVALGTMVPMIVFEAPLVFIACRLIHMNIHKYLWQVAVPLAIASMLLLLACWGINRIVTYQTWGGFVLKAGIGLVCFLPLAWAVVFRREERTTLAHHAKNAMAAISRVM